MVEYSINGDDRSHMDVIEISSVVDTYVQRHELCLNTRGSGKPAQLMADKIRCSLESCSVSVIVGVRS